MDEKRPMDGSISNLEKTQVEKRGRKPGSPKTGGRAKGVPNKSTTAWSTILDQKGFNIAEEAINLFSDKNTSSQLKFHILQFLAQYTKPSLKPTESEETPTQPTQDKDQTPADILSIVKS